MTACFVPCVPSLQRWRITGFILVC